MAVYGVHRNHAKPSTDMVSLFPNKIFFTKYQTRALYTLSYFNLKLCEVDMITPILLMRKLRLKSGSPKILDLGNGPFKIQTQM